jgi:hypothetical protein
VIKERSWKGGVYEKEDGEKSKRKEGEEGEERTVVKVDCVL